MTVAREPEVERERGQITGVRELDEGSRQTKLHQVLVQRHAFDAAEQVREVRRGGVYRARDVDEQQAARQVCFEILLRPEDEPRRRSAIHALALPIQLKARSQQGQHQLVCFEVLAVGPPVCPVLEPCAKALQMWLGATRPLAEERVLDQRLARAVRNLGENLAIGGDDQLGITVTNPAHAKRFSAPDEHDLVGIANDVVVADVPDEETARYGRQI